MEYQLKMQFLQSNYACKEGKDWYLKQKTEDLSTIVANLKKENKKEYLDWLFTRFCGYGYLEVVKYLIEKGADVNAYEDYALRYASRNGHLEVVKYLVEKGADTHACEDYALRWASEAGQLEVVKYLKSIKRSKKL